MSEESNIRTLIITEKADAARRISYILSGGSLKQKRDRATNYIEFTSEKFGNVAVVPLSGHIVQLDFKKEMQDWKTTDLESLVNSEVIKEVTNKTAFNTLSKLGPKASVVVVATDYDREGELIGLESVELIMRNCKTLKLGNIRRAKFSALTSEEVNNAFENQEILSENLAMSAAAREEIDLYWGAVLTRFFSITAERLGKNFISIGRVQTPTLALIVERELEIMSFKPEPFWTIDITFNKKRDFAAHYKDQPITEKEKADKIYSSVKGQNGTVTSFERKNEKIYKPIPFNTTEFLREASRIGVVPAKAMNIAESLYNRGLISYPRTDNTVYNKSISFKNVLSKLLNSEFETEVKKVLEQEKIIPSRGKVEATDHPPIYPVSAPKKDTLKGDFHKIYELILRRFLATLYRVGEREVTDVELNVNSYPFVSKGSRIIDYGWLELYPYRKVEEVIIPDLDVGELVNAKEWNLNEEKTKPPYRYDYASLIKKMEDLNLGTKSTRHDIIEKLQARGFIEGNPVRPSHLGMGLIEALLTVKSDITKPDMTAELEKDMDEIADGKQKKEAVVDVSKRMLLDVLQQFYQKKDLIKKTIQDSLKKGTPIGKCPIHNLDISVIKGRDFVRVKCEDETCKINFPAPIRGKIELLDEKCPVCGLPEIKVIRQGQSPDIRCIDPKCSFNSDRDFIGKCPKDGGNLVIRQSRFGKRFLGCSNYPKCDVTYPLPQMGYIKSTGEVCKYCGAPILVATRKGASWTFCPKIDCEFNKEMRASRAKRTAKQSA